MKNEKYVIWVDQKKKKWRKREKKDLKVTTVTQTTIMVNFYLWTNRAFLQKEGRLVTLILHCLDMEAASSSSWSSMVPFEESSWYRDLRDLFCFVSVVS